MDSLSPFTYLIDPVLRGPTIGSMLMCMAAALVGTILFLRHQSLIGEALSHASYPGVVVGIAIAGRMAVDEGDEGLLAALIIVGAASTAFLGLWMVHWLERSYRIQSDAALCFVLSTFFGIGLTLASDIQFSYPTFYRQAQTYLYGQAATMTDLHIMLYGGLAVAVLAILFLLHKELQIITFNQDFAKSLGIPVHGINILFSLLTVISVVIGIRSVGVVLMSAMLIAPAAAARQYTNRFSTLLKLAALFGMVSAYLGNYLSVEWTRLLTKDNPSVRLSLPTGPMIVMVASTLCLISLFISPKRGFMRRLGRIAIFRYQCISENLLKLLWRYGEGCPLTVEDILKHQQVSRLYMYLLLTLLCLQGWVKKYPNCTYSLTAEGTQRAARIVRLHRLWEVYLVTDVGLGAERVHCNAEEMEHILTPELEKALTLLLKDPQVDPHHQKIPPKEY
jgi:manganese/zinc/iron transport system permease protein